MSHNSLSHINLKFLCFISLYSLAKSTLLFFVTPPVVNIDTTIITLIEIDHTKNNYLGSWTSISTRTFQMLIVKEKEILN